MADDIRNASGTIPPAIDPHRLLAEGFFPCYAPRSIGRVEVGEALRNALDQSCAASAAMDPRALLAQPPLETTLATIRHGSHAAAGFPAIVSSFAKALRLPELRVAGTRRQAAHLRVL